MTESVAPLAALNPEPGPQPLPATASATSAESGGKARQAYMSHRTRCWSDDEFIRVNGWPLVYSLHGGELRVRLPGGRAMTPDELRAAGAAVVYPQRIHIEADDAN